MGEVKRGDQVVIGREGVRVTPLQRPRDRDVFSFMESQVSSQRPHGRVISEIASGLGAVARRIYEGKVGSKVLLAGGPAIVHAGGCRSAGMAYRRRVHPCLVLRECAAGSRYGSRSLRHVPWLWACGWSGCAAWT